MKHQNKVERFRQTMEVGLREDLEKLLPTDAEMDALRPKLRSECKDGPRPCPWVSCRYHLWSDVNPKTGSIKLNFPELDIFELEETCALDVVDRGDEPTLEILAGLLNITRERVRQIEARALLQLRVALSGLPPAENCEVCGVAALEWFPGCGTCVSVFAALRAKAILRGDIDLGDAWEVWAEERRQETPNDRRHRG